MFMFVIFEYDICIDFGEKKFLIIEEICRIIVEVMGNFNFFVILLIFFVFIGGWNCWFSFMGLLRCFVIKVMELIVRFLGGVFVDIFMKVFISC